MRKVIALTVMFLVMTAITVISIPFPQNNGVVKAYNAQNLYKLHTVTGFEDETKEVTAPAGVKNWQLNAGRTERNLEWEI
ncbi:hypothetical protein JOC37_001620 [Desulfohalotomaculum tongense]|uniref:hypothetical protein n=1 Tax=Desulforadius tongensis TaxID=1216062 RepID=UPI00195E365B|nr:hypothetical protein [Desulforadius tongensis]MBM7855227.1 hypothetical protein [Desulforadius tongensis]